jgi:hypothetical protein
MKIRGKTKNRTKAAAEFRSRKFPSCFFRYETAAKMYRKSPKVPNSSAMGKKNRAKGKIIVKTTKRFL